MNNRAWHNNLPERIYRRIRRELIALINNIRKATYRFKRPVQGEPDWLIQKEIKYGGLVTNIPRNTVSPNDPRTQKELMLGGMTGGDRMFDHGYAAIYAHYLNAYDFSSVRTLAEFGILTGTGLAIWCDLFREARVIGLDIDLDHFRNNDPGLHRKGAFKKNNPELHIYDQLVDGKNLINSILNNESLDIVIDDGLHSPEAIIMTFNSVKPFLSDRFVYFIEDYDELFPEYGHVFDGFQAHKYGLMTVILPLDSRIGFQH